MYTLAIYLYLLCVKVAALFHKKARLMVNGHRNTWRLLRSMPKGEYYWFHAASLGEFEQGRPLMERLRRQHPEARILLTFFSPSGYEVRKNYDGADVVCYLPFDTPFNARRFVRMVQPKMVFLIKYEFWRNYIACLHHRGVPVYSVSSIFRPDQVFFRWYGRKYARCLRRVTHFFVQNEASRTLLARLGITDVTIVGDTRFDRVIDIREAARPLPLVERFAGTYRVLVAGSSWGPCEDLIIPYFNTHPNLKLVLAPHVVSADHLAEIERKLERPGVRYSEATPKSVAEADCLIIDCYGLLSSIYRYATVAYVGGGFGVGIHNVPEAAVYGCPVLIGPNNRKFREAQDLLAAGGCIEVTDAATFAAAMDRFLGDRQALAEAGEAAGRYIHSNAGAADAIYAEIGL
ncbi:MAG: glycosyltransferase N-terminal domain-containing protein [Alloprevotella sp.]|nr:glycosyltransferase N-terminal domain-containing protein [Alloprevotella sp.]MDY6033900.1 glycosyltransferase N-terminal domain-containing protein [Alloprevotella sp.]